MPLPYDAQSTQRLTTEDLRLAPYGAGPGRWTGAVASLLLVVAVIAGLQFVQSRWLKPVRMAEMEREAAQYHDELHRARAELEMEKATRTELRRQVDELNDQVSELNQQLGFLKQRGPLSAGARSTGKDP